MLPGEDPDLAPVWQEMTPTERLLYQVIEDEPVPDQVSQGARDLFRQQRDLDG